MNTDLELELQNFNGTQDYHRHFLGLYYTDGVKYLAEQAKAFWLIDAIASHQIRNVKREPFQVWTLLVGANQFAILKCTDGDKGTGEIELTRQHIEYTDFPLEKITLYLEDGSLDGIHACKILMLPQER
jgi:hypothetical protein